MTEFTTTDMYLAAYMRMHATNSQAKKVGGKIVFTLTFPEEVSANVEHDMYLMNAFLQDYITQVKEVRGEVYRLMKQ